MSKRKVLIVGGGIAGLSLANALELLCKETVEYQLIERQQQVVAKNAGIALPANAVNALHHINLAQTVRENAFHVREMVFADDHFRELSRAATDHLHPKGFPFLSLSRDALHDILLTKPIQSKISLGLTLLNLKEKKDKIEATFSDGQQASFDLVVGADGIRSIVRKLTSHGKDETPLSLGITNWRMLVKRSDRLFHPTYVIGPGSVFMLFPISKNDMFCYAGVLTPPNGISEDERKSLHFMKSHFEHIGQEVKFALDQIIDPNQLTPDQLETVREVKTHSLEMKNVLFIGDAAHACSPIFHQGGAMSIEDAIIFAKLLSAFEALPTEQIIKFYDKFRFKTIQEIQTLSNFVLQRAMQAVDPQSIEIRNQKIKQEGPINIAFWKEYLKTDVFEELDNFIRTRLN